MIEQMQDWVQELSYILDTAMREAMNQEFIAAFTGHEPVRASGVRVSGYWVDEATLPALHGLIVPVPPSWLEPKCEHWRDWTFPKIVFSAIVRDGSAWWQARA